MRFHIKVSHIVIHKADLPHVVFDLPQAHIMASEHRTKVDLLTIQTNASAVSYKSAVNGDISYGKLVIPKVFTLNGPMISKSGEKPT